MPRKASWGLSREEIRRIMAEENLTSEQMAERLGGGSDGAGLRQFLNYVPASQRSLVASPPRPRLRNALKLVAQRDAHRDALPADLANEHLGAEVTQALIAAARLAAKEDGVKRADRLLAARLEQVLLERDAILTYSPKTGYRVARRNADEPQDQLLRR